MDKFIINSAIKRWHLWKYFRGCCDGESEMRRCFAPNWTKYRRKSSFYWSQLVARESGDGKAEWRMKKCWLDPRQISKTIATSEQHQWRLNLFLLRWYRDVDLQSDASWNVRVKCRDVRCKWYQVAAIIFVLGRHQKWIFETWERHENATFMCSWSD